MLQNKNNKYISISALIQHYINNENNTLCALFLPERNSDLAV